MSATQRAQSFSPDPREPSSLDELPEGTFEAVVTMGCGDACPHVLAKRREDWQIPDPRELPPQEFRQVRDLIEAKVKRLLESLADPGPANRR